MLPTTTAGRFGAAALVLAAGAGVGYLAVRSGRGALAGVLATGFVAGTAASFNKNAAWRALGSAIEISTVGVFTTMSVAHLLRPTPAMAALAPAVPAAYVVTESDSGKSIAMRVGDTLEFQLPAAVNRQYWMLADETESGIFEQVAVKTPEPGFDKTVLATRRRGSARLRATLFNFDGTTVPGRGLTLDVKVS